MSKLTARLSDGTEWEVENVLTHIYDAITNEPLPGHRMASLKPIAKKPSPPKEVWVAIEKSTGLCGAARPIDIGGGISHDYNNFRYVLAEEPKCMTCGYEMQSIAGSNRNYFCSHCIVPDKKPQPREWWDVRTYYGSVYASYMNEADAKEFLATLGARQRYYKVVHVREVLP